MPGLAGAVILKVRVKVWLLTSMTSTQVTVPGAVVEISVNSPLECAEPVRIARGLGEREVDELECRLEVGRSRAAVHALDVGPVRYTRAWDAPRQ